MSRISALGDMLGSILESGARLVDWSGSAEGSQAQLQEMCARLLSSRGEASGVALAAKILAQYRSLDGEARHRFFQYLAEAHNPDPERVAAAAAAYGSAQDAATLGVLFDAVEPPRQELLRRLNTAPEGTRHLVEMRADLLVLMRDDPALAIIDADFRHLLGSWFNRGFLVMRPVNWDSPAAVLEKIIAYEAVHEIDSWDELRRRVQPADRRCFAFFHPSMPDEPLIFVEVALAREIPGSIQTLLAPDREIVAQDDIRVAVFYSISNCQAGLAGVSFGAFLIKQVARDLAAESKRLETFVTLSPVPGFVRWLGAEAAGGDAAAQAALTLKDAGDLPAAGDPDAKAVMALAARYFLGARRDDGQPPDPVARFHLGNGAELAALHWQGDVSPKGRALGLGLMVNYLYRLDRIEANHEAYVGQGAIAASKAVRALL